MAYFQGTLIPAPIVRGSSTNTYGTHHSVLGIGGYMEVNTITERNNIPTDSVIGFDGISSGQRRIGMQVFVHDDGTGNSKTYQLYINRTLWNSYLTDGIKVAALSDNGNWVLYNPDMSNLDNKVGYDVFSGYTGTTQSFLNLTVTGASNNGFFSGTTGIQTLNIQASGSDNDGLYNSLGNNYFRDTNGIIRIGSPTFHGNSYRGYLRTTLPSKSWIYNLYTGSTNQVGWILINGDISTSVGVALTGITYSGTPYTGTTWTTGFHNNGGDLTVDVSGDITSGSTYNSSAPIFQSKINQELELRSLKSIDNNAINITFDDNFIYFSGNTSVVGITGGTNGLTKVGSNLTLGGILTDSGTTITDNRSIPIGIEYGGDYSSTYTDRSLVDKAYANKVANIKNVIMLTGTSYIATTSDYFIGASGGTTIFLPSIPLTGQIIIVADIQGNADINNILVNGNGKFILTDGNQGLLNTTYASMTFIYNGIFWSVIAFYA